MSDKPRFSDDELIGLCSFLVNHRRHHPDAAVDWAWVEAVAQRLQQILAVKGRPGPRKSAIGYAAEDVEIFRSKFGWSQEEARRAVAHWRKMDYDKVADAHRRMLRKKGVTKPLPE